MLVLACAALLLGAVPAMAADACATLARQVDAAGQGAVFVASYPTATDKALRNVAFLYDNAAAALALTGCGDILHAARIGDAILAAQAHDLFWTDGRLRNGYLAGTPANPVKLGGWQEGAHWAEDAYQSGSDTGNMAWAMLALLGLHRAGAGDKYLHGALRIAAYAEKSLNGIGFASGTFGGEPKPQQNRWKSTEHNIDLAAAFAQMAAVTHDPHWALRAAQARALVAAMWDRRSFAVGTGLDGKTPNHFLALDAQLWPLLALPGEAALHGAALKTARAKMTVNGGFTYSEAGRVMWTEGTAQAALLAALMHQPQRKARLLAVAEANRAPAGSYYAADREADTGFRLDTDPSQARSYFHLPHLGALAWVALAQQGFNPFTGTRTLP
jgi:hypothetical protein